MINNIYVALADSSAKGYLEYAKLYINFAKEMAKYTSCFATTKLSLKDFNLQLQDSTRPIYFLYIDNKVVGFASIIIEKHSYFSTEKDFYIHQLCISQNERSKGLGSIFFNELKKIAKKSNANNITLCNFKENVKALSFYKKQNMIPLEDSYEELLLAI